MPPRRRGKNFTKPWHGDAHLPKLDVRLLPVIKMRRWTAPDLEDFCRENVGGEILSRDLIERWLASATERGLVRQLQPQDGIAEHAWEITDRGFAYRPTFSRVLDRLGGLAGLAGIVALLVGIVSDRVSSGTQEVTGGAFFLAAVLLIGYVVGAGLAERGDHLLKRVAAREAEVQRDRLEARD